MNDSSIEWCDLTWNPVTGCPRPKVSPGCAHCYAERVMNTRLRHLPCYRGGDEPFQVLTFHGGRLLQPLQRKKPARIFVCSMGDLFHDFADDEWIFEIFAVMALCPQHTFMLLTKRPERMRDVVLGEENNGGLMFFGALDRVCRIASINTDGISIAWPLFNVWLGVTICNQAEADEKIPVLLDTPAAKRFVSVEPMLGSVEIRQYLYGSCTMTCGTCMAGERSDAPNIDWVIAGPETGPGKRPMDTVWVRSLLKQCRANDKKTPFFLKKSSDGSRLLDGREWNEVPS